MTLPEYLFEHLGPFMLLAARLGGLFAFAPFLSSNMLPSRARVGLLLMLSLALLPLAGDVSATSLPPMDMIALSTTLASEALIGVFLGLVAGLPLYAAQLGGQLMDHQIGMGLASVFNPAVESDTTIIADLVLNIGIALFISLGGLDALFLGVARTLAVTPLGAATIAESPLELIVSLTGSGFELALRVAAPVLGVITLETVAAAVLSKTMPQINILTIGFAIKIVAGLVTLVAALSPINGAVSDSLTETLRLMLEWASAAH